MQPLRSYASVALRNWYVVAALVIIALAALVRVQAGMMPTPVSIPTSAMPHPNARDYYTTAEALMRDAKSVDSAAGSRAYLSSNAVSNLAENDRLVAENRPAIAMLHEGMSYPCVQPRVDFRNNPPSYFEKDLELAELLSLEGQTKAAHGDWTGAMSAYLDAIRFGSDLTRGAGITGLSIGIGCDNAARRHADEAIDHLSSSAARAAAARLAAINASDVPVSEAVQVEEWSQQASLQAALAQPRWRERLVHDIYYRWYGRLSAPSPPPLANLVFHAESAKAVFDGYTRYMDEVVAQTKRPWPAQRKASAISPPSALLAMMMAPSFDLANLRDHVRVAFDRLLETRLALRAYRVDHGSYPASLDQLVPAYLPSVPTDPFTDGKPLQYKSGRYYEITFIVRGDRNSGLKEYKQLLGQPSGDDQVILYSVGPDARDDGGVPIFVHPRGSPSLFVVWDSDEKGDIVPGVNF